MSEAFLGSIEAIQGAFSLPDPTPQLLELIHAHPETPTIGDIVIICYELVLQFPSQVNKLAGILVNLKSTTFTIGASDRNRKPMQVSIGWALNQELVGLLDSELAYVQNDFVSVTPRTNISSPHYSPL